MIKRHRVHKNDKWFHKDVKCLYTTVLNKVDQHILEVYMINKQETLHNVSSNYGVQSTFAIRDQEFIEFNESDFLDLSIKKKPTKVPRQTVLEKREKDIILGEGQKLSFLDTLFDDNRDNFLRIFSNNAEELLIIIGRLKTEDKKVIEHIFKKCISIQIGTVKVPMTKEIEIMIKEQGYLNIFSPKNKFNFQPKNSLIIQLDNELAIALKKEHHQALERLRLIYIERYTAESWLISNEVFKFSFYKEDEYIVRDIELLNKFFEFPEYLGLSAPPPDKNLVKIDYNFIIWLRSLSLGI